jgi:hypothetical protein
MNDNARDQAWLLRGLCTKGAMEIGARAAETLKSTSRILEGLIA